MATGRHLESKNYATTVSHVVITYHITVPATIEVVFEFASKLFKFYCSFVYFYIVLINLNMADT